jgi:hypothetical protein
MNNKTQQAITDLAALKDGWSLMADTDPAEFLTQVREELVELRARNDSAQCTCCCAAPATHHYCAECYVADGFDAIEQRARLLAAADAIFEVELNYAAGGSWISLDKLLVAVQGLKAAVEEVEGGQS